MLPWFRSLKSNISTGTNLQYEENNFLQTAFKAICFSGPLKVEDIGDWQTTPANVTFSYFFVLLTFRRLQVIIISKF